MTSRIRSSAGPRRPVPRLRLAPGLALLLLALAACVPSTPPALRFLAPGANAALTFAPLTLRGDMASNYTPGSLVVTLNGVDVSAAFLTLPPSGGRIAFIASDFFDAGVLVDGENVVQANASFDGTGRGTELRFTLSGDAFADAVGPVVIGSGGGFGSTANVLGPPRGAGLYTGSLDVLSLGLSGQAVLAFTDNVVVDGPGDDLTVFENTFLPLDANAFTLPPFSEPGVVEVSQDGVSWHAFPCDLASPPYYPGCAGIYPVFANGDDPAAPHGALATTAPITSLVGQDAFTLVPPSGAGGDGFDLADVGLSWARYVRITAASFSTGPVGPGTAGFDLDAVAAVHSAPPTDANGNGIPDAVE